MMKICHLTSVHPQYDVRILHKECCSLAKKYETHLVVVNGKSVEFKNVKIHSVDINYSGRIERFTKVVDAVYKKAIEIDANVYHFHDPELLRIALKLKRKGKKVIYDAHEDLPKQILYKPYLNKIIAFLLSLFVRKYENYISSKIAGVVCATPYIRDRYLTNNSHCVDINNFPLLEEFSAFSNEQNLGASICYVGGLSEQRGIIELVEMLDYTDKHLVIAGSFTASSVEHKITSLKNWQKVDYRGVLDRNGVADLYKESAIGIVTLYPTENYKDALPVKMFEYMAAGLVVIASDIPLWKIIIEENNCGVTVNPFDSKAIALKIEEVFSNNSNAIQMGKNGRDAVLKKYNWSIEEKKLLKFYENLIKQK